ncbi:TPA: hypothetical protein MIY29_30195, partial [Klebsiella pneumoniae]|nr:hypothetical protein [Klebsiella pneumoniae]
VFWLRAITRSVTFANTGFGKSMLDAPVQPDKPEHKNRPNDIFHHHLIRGRNNIIKAKSDMQALVNFTVILEHRY